jgi:hypothetical protein
MKHEEITIRPFGEIKSTAGSMAIRNVRQLKLARAILDELEEQFASDVE